MNIQGGGISFEISATNDKLLRILEQSKSSMRNFSGEVKKGGKDIDGAFNSIVAAISKARADLDKTDIAWTKTYDNLTAKLNEVKAAQQNAWSTGDSAGFGKQQQATQQLERQVAQWEKLGQTIRSAYTELDAEEASIRRQYDEATKLGNAHVSIRTQLAKAKNTLMEMEQQGKRGTEEYQKQQAEVVRLAQAMRSANAQQKNLANPNRNFQAVIGGLSLMTSGYQAVTGAMGLFAGENENLQRIMTKVQSVMSITMALQTAYTQLNKNSAFQLVLVAKAKDMLTAANTRLAAALGISTATAQALMATLTLGLSAAITAIVVLLAKFQSKAAAAKKEQENFNKSVAEAAGKPLTAYMSLQTEWLSLTGSMKEREKWVQDNADKFQSLGWEVRNAAEAEEVLVRNTAKVVEAMMARAKATAAQQMAVEKYKAVMDAQQKLDRTPKAYVTKNGEYTDGYGNKKKGKVLVKDSEWQKAEDELAKAQEAYQQLIDTQVRFTQEEQRILAQIGHQAGAVVEGSVNAARKELQRLQTLYDNAATEVERNDLAKQIEAQQRKVDALSRKTKTNGNSGSGKGDKKDPYAEQLADRKRQYSEYSRWVQSQDETVRAAASSHFESLLQEGTSYLDFLTKKRDEIMAKQKKTGEDTHKLQLLNNEIAETTKQTVLADFDKQLQADLDACKTIGEMLDVIERRREQLDGDNSDVDNGKADILQNAQEDTERKAKEETAALLQEYAQYLNEKVLFEESYARKKELLAKQSEQAATEAERQVALAALDGLERKRREYEKRSASERYDELKNEYKNYEQQLNGIRQKYQDERNEATKQGDYAMIAQINAKEQEAISKLAAQKLMASESWTQLFSDLSTLSNKAINKLMTEINSQKVTLSAQFNPSDLQAINAQLQKAKDELHTRNPFLALKDSLKELRAAMKADKLLDDSDPFIQDLNKKKKQYQDYTEGLASSDEAVANSAKEKAKELLQEGSSYVDYLRKRIEALQNKKISIGISVDEEGELSKLEASLSKETGATKSLKEGFKDAFGSVSSSIDFVKGSFDSVVDGMKKMGITMDEETEAILGDISGMMAGASQIATGNPLSIIQGSVTFLSSAFDLFNSRDRKAEKAIKKHEKAVTRLGRAYTQLQHAVDNALGESVYQNQSAMIRNLRQQQEELNGMIEAEGSKKHADQERIEEWQEQMAEAGREIENIMNDLTKSITQTDAKSLADELGAALVEAFTDGTNAAKSFDKVAGDILRNAVLNALKVKILQPQLEKAIKQLQKDMGFDEEGNGTFDGLTKAEQDRFRSSVKAAGAQFQEAFKLYEDLFNELNENDPSTLSGAIKGASQESIDLLAGQANAVRMNQVTSLALLREQLQRLGNIDANVGVIAGRLLTIVNRLSTPGDDGLRGQGITE